MNVEVFSFPTLRDGRVAVEEKYCELVNRYRNGDALRPEERDWMDTANNWLSSTGTKL